MLTFEQYMEEARNQFGWGKKTPPELTDRQMKKVFRALGWNEIEETKKHRIVRKSDGQFIVLPNNHGQPIKLFELKESIKSGFSKRKSYVSPEDFRKVQCSFESFRRIKCFSENFRKI